MNTVTKLQAILSLVPGAEVTVRGEEVEWINPSDNDNETGIIAITLETTNGLIRID